jgi:hypothetical protein
LLFCNVFTAVHMTPNFEGLESLPIPVSKLMTSRSANYSPSQLSPHSNPFRLKSDKQCPLRVSFGRILTATHVLSKPRSLKQGIYGESRLQFESRDHTILQKLFPTREHVVGASNERNRFSVLSVAQSKKQERLSKQKIPNSTRI